MLSKNNRGLRLQKYSDRKQRFTIKRFSVGVASVLIGTAFMMYGSASADQVSSLKSGEASSVVTQDNNQINSGSETGNPEATSTETSTVTKETPSVNSTQEETSVDSVSQDTETSVTTKEVSSQNASEESTFTQLNTKQLSTSVDTSATDEVATNQLSASLLATTPTLVATGNRSMGTTDTGAVKNYTFDNLAFNFDNLSDASVKAGNDINFRISIYQKGANSGSNWQIRLQLDSTIAEQVSSIKAHPVNRPDKWVYFERQAGTNIWAAPYIRANGGIFGGADLGAYTVDGVIELKDTVGNVIANDNNNIPYRAYVYDQHNQAPISSSITEGYFNTLPEPQISNDTTRLNKFKKLSASSQVRFDPTVGEYGAFIVDETILKNGTLALVMQYNLDDTQYHINIDPELVDKFENPEYYIGRYDFGGPGFIPTYFEEDYRATTSFNDQGQAYFDIPDATASLGNTTSKKEYLNVNGAQNPIIVRTVLKLKQSAYDLMTTDASGEPVFLIPKDSAILPVELYFSDNNGGMFPTTYTTGGLLAQELPTNVDANVKPVLPTGDKQDTGIKVEYATDKTTITATDANGNDVPVEKDEKTGEVYVSTKGAKGPIKVTVSDPSMITNVDGVKTGEFTADVPVVVIPEKTPVANVSELTDKEKREVENKVKEANKDVFPDPDNTAVTVENDGTATITYPDKSTQTIPGSDLVRLAPQGKDVTVEKGKTPEAKQGIANEKDLPKGTTYEWKTPVDTSTPGETEGTVEVTYPDGTKDEVPVKVHVTDPRTDADKNDPKGQDINVNVNDEPKAEDGISNKDDMPSGTKYEWKDGQTPDT
ncbi:Rib/alpha-like domain-containing protein, partial [Ligilactobacillus salivarius]